MNGGQVAFYATVATAIPVLILGYVAGLLALVRGWERHGKQQFAIGFIFWAVAGSKRRFGGAYWLAKNVMVLVAVLVALLGPIAGEYFALHALLQKRSTSGASLWATVGIATSGVAVIYPSVALMVRQVRPAVDFVRGTTQPRDPRTDEAAGVRAPHREAKHRD